jgi:hypothetical protein
LKRRFQKGRENVQVTMRKLRLRRKSAAALLSLLIFTIYAFSTACSSSKPSTASGSPGASETSPKPPPEASISQAPQAPAAPQPVPPEPLSLQPPTPEEVREVVARVYKDTVEVVMTHQQSAMVGDFNGDGSQDIGVVIRPVRGKLEEINSEVANWIVEDPRKVSLPDPDKTVQTLPPATGPVKVEQDDLLLTIIHGYREAGWRNPEAQQAYMLYDAVGNSMVAESLENLQSALGNKSAAPRSADVIKQKLAGAWGFLYWTGAKYAWHKQRG